MPEPAIPSMIQVTPPQQSDKQIMPQDEHSTASCSSHSSQGTKCTKRARKDVWDNLNAKKSFLNGNNILMCTRGTPWVLKKIEHLEV